MGLCLRVSPREGVPFIEQEGGELVVLRNEKAARNYIAARSRLRDAAEVKVISEQEAREMLDKK